MSKQVYNEEDFIRILKDGNPEEFAVIYDSFSKALFGIILRIIEDEEQAADVLQDAFIKIWNNRTSYDKSKGTLFTWMLNIARNTAIDLTRTGKFKNSAKIRNLEDNVGMINKSFGTSTNTDVIGMEEVVESLPAEQRQIIDLMYYQGMSQEDISGEFNIPLGTVKTRARSAMGKLRQFFNAGIKS